MEQVMRQNGPFLPILGHSASPFDDCVGGMKDFLILFLFTKSQRYPKFQKIERMVTEIYSDGRTDMPQKQQHPCNPITFRQSQFRFSLLPKILFYIYNNILQLLTKFQINCMDGSIYDSKEPFYPF